MIGSSLNFSISSAVISALIQVPRTHKSIITRPDTRLPQSRAGGAGGQGPYLRSQEHLGRSSEVKAKE